MSDKTCEVCVFFRNPRDSINKGECRKKPPVVSTHMMPRWPVVFLDDWCGEWRRYDDSAMGRLVAEDDREDSETILFADL